MSKSIIDDLATNATLVFISQVRKTLLPAISVKYNIPIEELCLLVDNTQKDNLPNKIVAKKSSINLADKILKSKANNKFYNITSGRDLVDNTANRKKYVFNDKLNIAASKDDVNFAPLVEKMTNELANTTDTATASTATSTMTNTTTNTVENAAESGKIVAKRKPKKVKVEPVEPEPQDEEHADNTDLIHVQASAAKKRVKSI